MAKPPEPTDQPPEQGVVRTDEPAASPPAHDDQVDEAEQESFPASDPPESYRVD